jgi:hypothetical protein
MNSNKVKGTERVGSKKRTLEVFCGTNPILANPRRSLHPPMERYVGRWLFCRTNPIPGGWVEARLVTSGFRRRLRQTHQTGHGLRRPVLQMRRGGELGRTHDRYSIFRDQPGKRSEQKSTDLPSNHAAKDRVPEQHFRGKEPWEILHPIS